MHRRAFLQRSAAATLGLTAAFAAREAVYSSGAGREEMFGPQPTYSVVPVVGDGRWVWTTPPTSGTGYLEPRSYDLKIGVQLEGTGNATQIRGTTVVPVELPEQKIEKIDIEKNGCEASVRQLATEAAQLALAAPSIAKGQIISALAQFRITLSKEYFGYEKDKFPARQDYGKELKQTYIAESPGIQTRIDDVRKLATSLAAAEEHPWEKAKKFYGWVWENIKLRPGNYTSVVAAIRDKVGDCEERAATFVALCRIAGIPARLVWVPNHNWAEFCLLDEEKKPHWIPAHTSCYSWFGWTGAHELMLQKGDRVSVPEKSQPQRLLADWAQWQGAKPKIRWAAELTPLPPKEGEDAGPGHRRKDEKGEWVVVGKHPLDAYLRDGARASSRPSASMPSPAVLLQTQASK